MPWDKQFNVEAVLDKAVRAFWARGYEATSMQDLVRQTGVNRASLYATYGDKHALFLAALRMYDGRLRHERLAEIERTCGPREAIRRLLLSFASGVSEKVTPRGCFLTNTALELAGHDAEASRVVAHAQREIEAFFGRMVKKGKATGEFGAHVKP
ncbi:MAG: TetR/AcrR family transcriptional regulator, partial [Vicinamibacterales bacterium]